MEPLAPPRLSTTMGWPRLRWIGPATVRVGTSAPPPGGQATTKRTGRSGQSACAPALAIGPADAAASTARRPKPRRMALIGLLLTVFDASVPRLVPPARPGGLRCSGALGWPDPNWAAGPARRILLAGRGCPGMGARGRGGPGRARLGSGRWPRATRSTRRFPRGLLRSGTGRRGGVASVDAHGAQREQRAAAADNTTAALPRAPLRRARERPMPWARSSGMRGGFPASSCARWSSVRPRRSARPPAPHGRPGAPPAGGRRRRRGFCPAPPTGVPPARRAPPSRSAAAGSAGPGRSAARRRRRCRGRVGGATARRRSRPGGS